MSASRACFALLRSGPADPQHGRLSYGSALAPGSLFPHATLRTIALRASLPSARIVAARASLSSPGTSGISSGLTEAGPSPVSTTARIRAPYACAAFAVIPSTCRSCSRFSGLLRQMPRNARSVRAPPAPPLSDTAAHALLRLTKNARSSSVSGLVSSARHDAVDGAAQLSHFRTLRHQGVSRRNNAK